MANLLINGRKIFAKEWRNLDEVITYIKSNTFLHGDDFYLEQGGNKLIDAQSGLDGKNGNIYCVLRIYGGKGGFGSMLRAIGAQIEKTTNREACRDLSGRRLRDINEEKRLKSWLEKQEDREREEEERKKRKIEKLLAVPKHEFKDPSYLEARSKVESKVNDAFEAGLKNSLASEKAIKRKIEDNFKTALNAKKKRNDKLWLDEDLSSDTDDSEEDDKNEIQKKTKSNQTKNDSQIPEKIQTNTQHKEAKKISFYSFKE